MSYAFQKEIEENAYFSHRVEWKATPKELRSATESMMQIILKEFSAIKYSLIDIFEPRCLTLAQRWVTTQIFANFGLWPQLIITDNSSIIFEKMEERKLWEPNALLHSYLFIGKKVYFIYQNKGTK